MLTTTSLADERITTAHRAKLAYIYVRQSSPGQVRHHQESTELQHRLVERAVFWAGRGSGFTSSTMISEIWRLEQRATRLPDADRGSWSRQGRAGDEPGCVPARAQQPGLASAAGIVLAVRRADRRWRAAI